MRAAIALVVFMLGCAGGPSTTTPAPSASTTTSPVTSASNTPAPTGGGQACSANTDCRVHSSYCAESPCACNALHVKDPDPKCASPTQVSCFADPCMNKTAACQNGKCELVMK